MSTHNMFSWRNEKKNYLDIHLIWSYEVACCVHVLQWTISQTLCLKFSAGLFVL